MSDALVLALLNVGLVLCAAVAPSTAPLEWVLAMAFLVIVVTATLVLCVHCHIWEREEGRRIW